MERRHNLIENYLEKGKLTELEVNLWVTDFYMDFNTGRVIRDIKPTEINPSLTGSRYKKYELLKIGKKGQKLKTSISIESASNGCITSIIKIFDTEKEALDEYIKLKEEAIKIYERNLNQAIIFLNNLKEDLKNLKKNN